MTERIQQTAATYYVPEEKVAELVTQFVAGNITPPKGTEIAHIEGSFGEGGEGYDVKVEFTP